MADRLARVLPLLLAPLVLQSVACRGVEIPATVDPAQIPSYRMIRPGLVAAGLPTPAAIAQLGKMGFRTVIDLRTESEGAGSERGLVEAQGLRYLSVPVTPESFSLADVETVEKALADPASGPVLLHCRSSNRVGGVIAVIEARKGSSLEQAEAAGREAGLRSPAMQAAVRRVLGAPAAENPSSP